MQARRNKQKTDLLCTGQQLYQKISEEVENKSFRTNPVVFGDRYVRALLNMKGKSVS